MNNEKIEYRQCAGCKCVIARAYPYDKCGHCRAIAPPVAPVSAGTIDRWDLDRAIEVTMELSDNGDYVLYADHLQNTAAAVAEARKAGFYEGVNDAIAKMREPERAATAPVSAVPDIVTTLRDELESLLCYAEWAEEIIDNEKGAGRSLKQIEADGDLAGQIVSARAALASLPPSAGAAADHGWLIQNILFHGEPPNAPDWTEWAMQMVERRTLEDVVVMSKESLFAVIGEQVTAEGAAGAPVSAASIDGQLTEAPSTVKQAGGQELPALPDWVEPLLGITHYNLLIRHLRSVWPVWAAGAELPSLDEHNLRSVLDPYTIGSGTTAEFEELLAAILAMRQPQGDDMETQIEQRVSERLQEIIRSPGGYMIDVRLNPEHPTGYKRGQKVRVGYVSGDCIVIGESGSYLHLLSLDSGAYIGVNKEPGNLMNVADVSESQGDALDALVPPKKEYIAPTAFKDGWNACVDQVKRNIAAKQAGKEKP